MSNKLKKINHLAIIPDGNRRWAKREHILDEEMIYQKGAERIKEIMEAVVEREIEFFTLWTSSLVNIRERTGKFRKVMNNFYIRKFNDLADNLTIREREVKIQVLGEWEENLDEEAVEAIKKAIKATVEYEKMVFTVLVGYDGKRERGSATVELMKDVANDFLNITQSFDEAEIKLRKRSWTGHLPNVDLLIRTGSWEDPHLSADFLTFLSGEAQLAFPQVFWPDFSKKELHKILLNYDKRERRFGK